MEGKGLLSEVKERTNPPFEGGREPRSEGRKEHFLSSRLGPKRFWSRRRGPLAPALSAALSARSFACRVFTEGSRFGRGTAHTLVIRLSVRGHRETTSTTAAPICFLLPFHRSTLRFFRPSCHAPAVCEHGFTFLAALQSFQVVLAHHPHLDTDGS